MTFQSARFRPSVAVLAAALPLASCNSPARPSPVSDTVASKVAVTATVRKESLTSGTFVYWFALQVNESAGVGARVSGVYIQFDNGFGAWCEYPGSQLTSHEIPPGGTLTLEPVSCGYPDGYPAFNASAQLSFIDANGRKGTADTRVEKLS